MVRMMSPAARLLAASLVLCAAWPASARATVVPQISPAAGQQPATSAATPASADEAAVRTLIESYYAAYGRKEVDALVAAWHPDAPGVKGLGQALGRLFEAYDVGFVGLDVSSVSASVAGGAARVAVTAVWKPRGGGPERAERWVRSQGFLQKDGVWKYWRDEPASRDLAVRMMTASTDEEREALVPADPATIDSDLLRAVEGAGHRLRDAGRFEDALKTYAYVRRLAERAGNPSEAARAQIDVGLVRLRQQRWALAYDEFAAARRVLEPLGDRLQTALCDLNMGHARYAETAYVEAESRFATAASVFAALREDSWTASALHSLGNARYVQGNLVKAVEAYEGALAVQSRVRDRFATASLQQALGLVRRDQGDFAAALTAYREALAGFRAAFYLAGVVPSFQGLAEVHRLQGQFDLALANARAGLTMAERIRDGAGQAELLFDIGRILATERRFAEATDSYQRSLALDQKAGNRPSVARTFAALGTVAYAERRFDRALELFRASVEIRRTLDDPPRVAWTEIHIGLALEAKALHQEAIEAYQRAFAIHEAAGDAKGMAVVHALIGDAHLAQVDTAGARDRAARAVALAEPAGDLDTLAHARLVDGKAARLAGDLAGARASFEASVALIERRTADDADLAQEHFFGDLGAPYVALANLDLAGHRNLEALAWAERARGRRLQSVVGRTGAGVSKGLTAEERDEELRLSRQLRSLFTQATRERERTSPDANRLATLESSLASTRAALVAHREALYLRHPTLKAMRGRADPIPVAELIASMGRRDAAVVEFLQSESRLLGLVLPATSRRSGSAADVAPPEVVSFVVDIDPAGLASMVAAFRSAVERRAPDVRERGRALYDLIVEPAEAALEGASRVIVIPDGVLWAIPFDALVDRGGRFLIESRTLSCATSLTAVAAPPRGRPSSSSPPPGTGSVLALANPVIAPDTLARLRLAYPGVAWASQPQAESEARRLSSIAGAGRASLATGAGATRSRLLQPGGRAAILHLAVPLLMNDSSPLYSELVLASEPGPVTPSAASRPRASSPTASSKPSEPASLPVPEVATGEETLSVASLAEAEFASDIAVFSRAGSTTAAPATGEAMAALAWALDAAGIRSLVVSRWPAETAAAPGLIGAIYRNLHVGGESGTRRPGLADAVRRAALDTMKRPGFRDPYYWAGFLVIDRSAR